jgi:hypothetical protein
MMYKRTALLALFAAAARAQDVCQASCDGEGDAKVCTFTAKLDIFASSTGYYQFEECGDAVMPTLAMEQGVTYRFVQNDETNWYHPLGFAYFPDGAHSGVDELEPGIGGDCAETETCQAPRYMVNGEFVGTTYDNVAGVGGDDFGLDVYEPDFQLGKGDWEALRDEGSGFEIHLTLTDGTTADIFYFCHVHTKMSGRIVIVDSDGNPVNPTPGTPELGYEYEVPSDFDKTCGTYDTGGFTRDSGMCPGGDVVFCDAMKGGEASLFSECMYALDCHMQHYMRVDLHEDPMASFMHQMIPHHENAVNMAKLLLKMGLDDAKDPEGEVEEMLHSIITGQNKQITMMRGWLEEYGYPASTDAQCGTMSDKRYDPSCCSGTQRRLLFGGENVACLCN